MTPGRRTVVVGEHLMPGYTVDDAMQAVMSLDSAVQISIAALDRPDGTAVLAVVLDAVGANGGALEERLVHDLQTVFSTVSVVESGSAALAIDDRLT